MATWLACVPALAAGEFPFGASWGHRNWRNVPGPIYGTNAEPMADELPIAGVARDLAGEFFLWRQPRDDGELDAVRALGGSDCYGVSFGCDGDAHWTLDRIRAWWSQRELVAAEYRVAGVPDLAAYFEGELPAFLRAYAFFVLEGRRPGPGELLPDIDQRPRLTITATPAKFEPGDAVELAARAAEVLAARGLRPGEPPLWARGSDRHPLGVPGLLFTARSSSLAAQLAPANLCADGRGTFVYRQPSSRRELEQVLEAAIREPLCGFGIETGRHQGVDALRAWWRDRDKFRAALEAADVPGIDELFARELPDYLRRYASWMRRGHLPEPGQALPELRVPPPQRLAPPLRFIEPHRLPFTRGEIFRERVHATLTDQWDDRHPLNIPGMFYGAETDTCGTGKPLAPHNIGEDGECGQEFVFRQPRDLAELEGVFEASSVDPFDGYGGDGNRRWTVELVRAWWAGRDQVLDGWRKAGIPGVDTWFADEVPAWLRAYLFFLIEGRPPTPDDRLPEL